MIDIYLRTLAACAPERLVRAKLPSDYPRNIVAIGKCAGALLDGIDDYDDAFVAIPAGYRRPSRRAEVHEGGHPHITRASFDAGHALLEFIAKHHDITFIISGGGSACVEVPAPGFSESGVIDANARLIASGLPIREINARRKRMSAIKGGKLRARGRQLVLIHSDVSSGRLSDVASGPCDTSEAILIADNATLVHAAANAAAETAASTHGSATTQRVIVLEEQIESDVEDAARFLASEARKLEPGQTLVAGGEPTVRIRGDGRGGRCIELAVRFVLAAQGLALKALFASSDGVDGNSGSAGLHLPRIPDLPNRHGIETALARSDSMAVAPQVGEPIMIAPTGNNLRDLFLVARD